MPPNKQPEDIVQIAFPYDPAVYKLEANLEEANAVNYQASTSQQELAEEGEEEPNVRITTRARISYETDRFNKNEMLVIAGKIADPDTPLYLLNTFEELKFDITVVDNNQTDELEFWRRIDQFFQKDFSNIGIAAVATFISSHDPATSRANRIQEWDVLNYFINHQPPTLQGRPKIFISEASEPATPPETIITSDTLIIQAKKVFHRDTGPRPLDLLCYKLMTMKGTRDILDILSELIHDASQEYPTHPTPITCLSTMSKELLLDKEINGDLTDENKESPNQMLIPKVLFSKLTSAMKYAMKYQIYGDDTIVDQLKSVM